MTSHPTVRWAMLRPLAAGAVLAGALLSGTVVSGVLLTPALAECTPDTNKDFPGDKDTDRDCLPDYAEGIYKTNPFNPDTDGDGITDFQEVVVIHTDPLVRWDRNPDGTPIGSTPAGTNPPQQGPGRPNDRDSDGLLDDDETNVYGTNPAVADTDGDGPDDGQEVFDGTDPLDPNDP